MSKYELSESVFRILIYFDGSITMTSFPSTCQRLLSVLLLISCSTVAQAKELGDFFEQVFLESEPETITVSMDALFMARTDSMHSVLMTDSSTGDVYFQTGQTDMGTMVGPMLNVIKDHQNGWGFGFRYFSVLNGTDSTNVLGVSDPFAESEQSFAEHFNGVNWGDLIQFDTYYRSSLHNFEFNLRKTLKPGFVVLT